MEVEEFDAATASKSLPLSILVPVIAAMIFIVLALILAIAVRRAL